MIIAAQKMFPGFNGIRTLGLCISAAVLHQLSYEYTHTLGAGQFIEFIVPVKGMKHEYYVNCGHTNEMKM